MSFQETLNKVKELQELAQLDLNGTPSASRPGWEAQKRQAMFKLPEAMASLLLETKNATTVLSLSGDTQAIQDFTGLASSRQDTVFVNRDEVYVELARGVFPQIGASGQFGVHNFYSFMRELQRIASEVGLTIQSQPSLRPSFIVNSLEHLSEHIKEIVEEAFGTTLAQRYLQQKISKSFLDKNPTSDKVFVVLTGGDEKFANLIGEKVVPMTLQSPITQENVAEAYAALKQQPVSKQTKNKQKHNKKDDLNE